MRAKIKGAMRARGLESYGYCKLGVYMAIRFMAARVIDCSC